VACDATQAGVAAAIAAASPGDVVSIENAPQTATWSSGVTINKALTLRGVDSATTVITSATSDLITISPATDVAVRVTGLGCILGLGQSRRAITLASPSTTNLTQLRIDHNAISGGSYSIKGENVWVYGVIDHNSFSDNYSPIYLSGDNDAAWERAYAAGGIVAGSANALFIEDNTFTKTAAMNGETIDADIYVQCGASVVGRYNTWDTTELTSVNFMTLLLNNHGNMGYYDVVYGPGSGTRGCPIFEFYHNTVHAGATTQFIGIRGGSVLIYENAFTATSSSSRIEFTEEEEWKDEFFQYHRSAWPAQDQVFNSFIWNNTYNASPITAITTNGANTVGLWFQENRDYFMHAPASSGGKCVFTGTRYGGSTTHPTDGDPYAEDTGSMEFSASGANAYYPYTSYTYPHPRTVPLGTPILTMR